MRTFFSLVAAAGLGLGGMLIVVSVVMLVFTLNSNRMLKALQRSPVLTCAELLTGRPPHRVIVRGKAQALPGRSLIGPVSGRDCVWYRLSATYEYRLETRMVRGQLWSYSTSARLSLSDGTGTVEMSEKLLDKTLRPDDFRYDNMLLFKRYHSDPPTQKQLASKTRRRKNGEVRHSRAVIEELIEAGTDHVDGFKLDPARKVWLKEELIVPDQQMVVLAVPAPEGSGIRLHAPIGGGMAGASARSLDEVRSGTAADAAESGALSPQFLKWGTVTFTVGLAALGLSYLFAP
jgi:hypothetical protein